MAGIVSVLLVKTLPFGASFDKEFTMLNPHILVMRLEIAVLLTYSLTY
jgi:hypothetical protein